MIAIRKLHLQYVCFQRLAIDFTGIKVLTADLGLKQMTKHFTSKIYYVFIQFREGKDVLLTRNQFGFDVDLRGIIVFEQRITILKTVLIITLPHLIGMQD